MKTGKTDKGIRSAREAALIALVRFERDEAYLNLLLPSLLRKLPPGERELARRLSYGSMTRLNSLDWFLSGYLNRPLDKFTLWIRNLMRISAYQVVYMKDIPDYAAVNEAVKLARRYGHSGVAKLVNAVLRQLVRDKERLPWPDSDLEPVRFLSLRHSHPFWLVRRAVEYFGFSGAEAWCQANNVRPPLSLRPNRLRIDSANLPARLLGEGVEIGRSPLVPGLYRLKVADRPVTETPSFREGLFSIQGESSAMVAPLLEPAPGQRIIDLCSAPGGKTTHLAELSGDCGVIYALDLHEKRLGLVCKAADRLGIKSIRYLCADGRKAAELGLEKADAVLVDAPCSGLGVIRRLPEIKWRRREEDLQAFAAVQLDLLLAAAELVKPGGRLLYSVCTTEPEETENVVKAFNGRFVNFKPLPLAPLLPGNLNYRAAGPGPVTLYPHLHDTDGFYMACWTLPRF